MSKPILFVYGTLKRGGRAHHLLAEGRYIGRATTEPHYRLYDLGPYPALVRDDQSGQAVRGELWELDDELIDLLDEYEGVAEGLYERTELMLNKGRTAQGYVYLGAVPPNTPSITEWAAKHHD